MEFSPDNAMLLSAIAFVLVAGPLLAIGGLMGSYDRMIEARLRELSDPQDERGSSRRGALGTVAEQLRGLAKNFRPTDERAYCHLKTRLGEAGIYSPAAVPFFIGAKCFLTLTLSVGAVTGAWVGGLSSAYAWLGGSLFCLIGLFLPHIWLERRRRKRHLILRRALPDFLDLVIACLGGGLSVQAALKHVAEELRIAHPELSTELQVVTGEIQLGRTLDSALAQFAARTGLDELRTLCSFVHQTTKFGTTITDALAQLAEMLRIQREQRAEELAQKAAVKILFPTLLFIFPTVFVVLAGPAAIQIRDGLKTTQDPDSSPTASK
jgi:tight adherence protein C